MNTALDTLQHMSEPSNGHFTTRMASESGVSRPMLSSLTANGKLVRLFRGHYIIADEIADEYALLQSRCSKAIFSYGTALYFWGLSDRVPHLMDVTVPQGTNISHIRTSIGNLRCHYVKPDIYLLGITETTSPMGNKIRLYDRERCICDLIRARSTADKQIYVQAIKDYFSGKPNLRKLIKYSKLLEIEDQIRAYMEVLL